MSNRYTQLFSLPKNQYAEGSPVLITAGLLLKDNTDGKILARLKFRNIGPKTIKALHVQFKLFDTGAQPLETPASHQYLDLAAHPEDEFGQVTLIEIPDATTRSYAAEITEVIFEDNSTWSGSQDVWQPLPAPTLLALGDHELEKQFRLKFGENCKYQTTEYKDLWRCACGAPNRKEESACRRCHNHRSALMNVNMEELIAARDERLAQQARKTKQLLAIGIPVALVLIITIILLITRTPGTAARNKLMNELITAGVNEIFSSDDSISGGSISGAPIPSDPYEPNNNLASAEPAVLKFDIEATDIGDTVLFGSYEQDNNFQNGAEDIEWIVLEKTGDRMLLISKYCLDSKAFNRTKEDITWEDCSLRSWLNNDFLWSSFTADEIGYIEKTRLSTPDNSEYGIDGGSDTYDQLFLLSWEEAAMYMPGEADRATVATAYAQSNGVFVHEETGETWWWLRTPGHTDVHSMYVYSYGAFDFSGDQVQVIRGGVRPAMWISAD